MTAAAVAPPAPEVGVVHAVDLWYPGQQDPIGVPLARFPHARGADPGVYVVWVAGRVGAELQPRCALHVQHADRVANADPPLVGRDPLTGAERVVLAELLGQP